jgi:multidrug transporter EmrE-like cation transporter
MPRAIRAPAGASSPCYCLQRSCFCSGALQVLEVGIAYAVWTGIGAAGTVLMDVLLFSETLSPMKLAGIALVLAGIAALKLGSA